MEFVRNCHAQRVESLGLLIYGVSVVVIDFQIARRSPTGALRIGESVRPTAPQIDDVHVVLIAVYSTIFWGGTVAHLIDLKNPNAIQHGHRQIDVIRHAVGITVRRIYPLRPLDIVVNAEPAAGRNGIEVGAGTTLHDLT